MTFESPSAFSIFLKRLVNPARKADDGWKTVKYNGRFLEQFKLELARRRLGMGSDDANSGRTHSPILSHNAFPTQVAIDGNTRAIHGRSMQQMHLGRCGFLHSCRRSQVKSGDQWKYFAYSVLSIASHLIARRGEGTPGSSASGGEETAPDCQG